MSIACDTKLLTETKKNLITDVSCNNPEFSDRPDYLIIPTSKKFASELLTHMANVNKLKVHAIEILDNRGQWLSSNAHTKQELLKIFESGESEDLAEDMCYQAIKIYHDYCQFSAIPKHCNDSEECHSSKISKEQLLEIIAD